jgi:hypothetical protein
MLRTVFVMMTLLTFQSQANAVNSGNSFSKSSGINSVRDSLQLREWALQFAVSDLLDIKNIAGQINLKKHFSSKIALRLGLNVTFKYIENDGNKSFSRTDLGSDLFVQFYFTPKKKFIFYALGGIQIKYAKYDNAISNDGNPDKLYNYGIGLGIGVEYFAFEALSLFSEYGANISYSRQIQINENSDEVYENIVFEDAPLSFGISVYF